MALIEGNLMGQGLRFAIVQARWNDLMGNRLLEGAEDCLKRHGCDQYDVVKVPGSFEIPLIAKKLALSGKYDAIICLGVLIRGGTLHFELIAGQTTNGISAVGLETGVPVTFGVITCDSLEQAMERSGSKAGNKGAEAALAAIEMANLVKQIG
ncbi:MAG: 6,7-dimethyl-8-ribityllumazine synthase [Acidobacteria bacterium]|nr:6,7-dimethyl-8-ribityllumazine synthase [Acidobacteriota bacterium]MCB9398109.1 6,7-dimethyl-8-ribityllumazine synthase [Acidobacteriota bacterium]